MKALIGFLTELCASSAQQLAQHGQTGGEYAALPTNALHLYRLGDIMTKVVGGGRPLLHVMRAWSVVSQHFVQVCLLVDN